MRFLLTPLLVPAITTLALVGCSKEKISCALGAGDRAAIISVTDAECAEIQTALAARSHQAPGAARPSAVEQEKAVRKYRANVAARMRMDDANGYKATSIENFKLHGQDLAHHDAKIAVQGVYIKTGRGEFLMPSSLATSQVDSKRTPDEGVNLLLRTATRSAKRSFGQCQEDSVKSKLGCPMTILGEAILCNRTTVFGTALAPCIAVNDSWYIPLPG